MAALHVIYSWLAAKEEPAALVKTIGYECTYKDLTILYRSLLQKWTKRWFVLSRKDMVSHQTQLVANNITSLGPIY